MIDYTFKGRNVFVAFTFTWIWNLCLFHEKSSKNVDKTVIVIQVIILVPGARKV